MKWGAWVLGLGVVACSSSSGTGAAGEPGGAGETPGTASVPVATKATGEASAWQELAALPTPRANHCAVAANGYLVVIGGNYKPSGKDAFVNLDDVVVAKIQDDGSLGAWKVAGHTPSPVNSCTATTDGKDVFLVDGIFENDALGKVVRRATLSSDGVLGAWQDAGALPDNTRLLYSVAGIVDGALCSFQAKLPDAGDAVSLLVTAVGTKAWQEKSLLAGFRGHPQYAMSGAFAYAIGGYAGGDNTVKADGAGIALSGAAVKVADLPKPTSFGQAAIVDDFLFVVGGKESVFGANGRADVFAAHIEADGSIASWASTSALPQGRTSHVLTRAGDFLYVTGGGYDAGGLDTVFAARVRFAP